MRIFFSNVDDVVGIQQALDEIIGDVLTSKLIAAQHHSRVWRYQSP